MGDPKMFDLYAVLGIFNQNASQQEIQVAYDKLSLKFPSDGRVGLVPSDAVELIKSAYDILVDPEKRAEYDQRHARVCREVKTTPEGTCNPRQKSPVDERFPAARVKLPMRIKKRASARRTPLRAQLRVQAQLRAHARRLAQIQRQGLRETAREAQIDSDDEFEKVWALVPQMFKSLESVDRDSARREDEKKEAPIRQAAEAEAKEIECITHLGGGKQDVSRAD